MELFANDRQTVEANESVMFQTALSSGSSSILWRIGSGIVTLRGIGDDQVCRQQQTLISHTSLLGFIISKRHIIQLRCQL